VHQAASWEESLLTAEAGVDIALTEIRKQLWDPQHAWTGWTNANGTEAAPGPTSGAVYRTSEALLRQGEGATLSRAVVSVEAPTFLQDATGEQWYRIRSRGICGVPGGQIVAGAREDVMLRKLNLVYDRQTRERLAVPTASRVIEAIARPQGAFQVPLLSLVTIDMTNHNIVVDSYDSRDPNKSTNGGYDESKRQWKGDIATNGKVINAGSAHIYGSASTNEGSVLNADNVTGNYPDDPNRIRTDYYQEIIKVTAPTPTPSPGTPSSISGSTTLTATAGDPLQVVVSGVSLSGSSTLKIAGAADGSPTYAQIVCNGNWSQSGQAVLELDPGVHVRIFIKGDADMTGNGVLNPNSPLNLQVYGCDRPTNPDGTPASLGTLKIAGNGGFSGTVYAPNYNIEIKGGGTADNVFGAFVGQNIFMNGVQSVHYDEALGEGGLITGYNIVSWFEDER
jgi:hypothetical protein